MSSAGWLGFALAELGEFEAARACVDQAQRAADTANHAYGQTIAWTMTGLVALRNGDLDRALLFLVRSLEASREKALTVWRPIPSSLLGLAYVYAGRVPEGLELLEQGVTLTEELGVKAYLALWTANHAEGLLVAGQVDAARARAQEALDLALAHKERGHQAWTLYLLAEIAASGEHPDAGRAEATYGQAAVIAEEQGMGPLRARIALGLGRLHVRAGDRVRGEDQLMAATALFRDMDMRYWLEQAGGELKALGHVFVIAEEHRNLYDFLARKFGEDTHVRVILDRRQGDRRRVAVAPGSERRRVERRQKAVDAMLRSRGFVVVPDPPANGGDQEKRAAKAAEPPRVDPARRGKPSPPRRPRA